MSLLKNPAFVDVREMALATEGAEVCPRWRISLAGHEPAMVAVERNKDRGIGFRFLGEGTGTALIHQEIDGASLGKRSMIVFSLGMRAPEATRPTPAIRRVTIFIDSAKKGAGRAVQLVGSTNGGPAVQTSRAEVVLPAQKAAKGARLVIELDPSARKIDLLGCRLEISPIVGKARQQDGKAIAEFDVEAVSPADAERLFAGAEKKSFGPCRGSPGPISP